MNDTLLTLVGNVVNDVRLSYTKSGHAVAQFRIANGTRRFDKAADRWVDADTHFFNVTMWREFAINAADSVKKGMPVVVYGKLRSREVQRPCGSGDDAHTHTVHYHDVEAFAVGPNLAKGTATFVRQLRAAVTENEIREVADEMIEREEYGVPFDDEVIEDVDLETGEIREASAASAASAA